MTDKLELLVQIGADMQADPERGFENYAREEAEYDSWQTLVFDVEYAHELVRRSPKPLITYDQIPWEWLKWDWVAMGSSGHWYND